MEIILLEKIEKLGNLGDRVRVKAGYGRNYLLPFGKAVPATTENIEKFESRRAELEKMQADTLEGITMRAEKINATEVTLAKKVSNEGKLYGSVNAADIAQAVTEAGAELRKNEVRLPEGPYRTVGKFEVDVHLYAGVDAKLKINIVAEE